MARMSIDDMFLRDPRIARLAKRLNVSKFDARGRLLEVIGIVYDRIDDVLTEDDIDIAAEIDGFAQRMVECDLAVPVRGKFRVRGATERIQYLRSREESGRVGGIKSGESRRKRHEAKTKVTFEANEAPSNPIPNASVPDLASVPDPDNPLKNSAPTSSGGSRVRKSKPKPSEPTADERHAAMFVLQKLGQRSGVAYSGAAEHVRLIVAQLRSGVSEQDLRKVIGYCAIELEWADKPEMAKYLRPETLFGPKTIARYLDAARTWFAKQPGLQFDERPRLEVVQ